MILSRVKSLGVVIALVAATLIATGISTSQEDGSFSFGVAGDFGYTTATQATFAAAGAAGLDFFVVVGDTTYDQATESEWCGAFRAQVPNVLIEAGNHDTGESSGADLNALVSACPYALNEPLTGRYGREWFFDYPGGAPLARFILTGCGTSFEVDGQTDWTCATGEVHYQFVSDAIDGARTAGIRWVVVAMHKNCITAASKDCSIGAEFFSLLLDKRVDLILQGHDHLYERSKQLLCATPDLFRPECVADDGSDGRYTQGNGAVLMIQGTGGRSNDSYDPTDSEAGYFVTGFGTTYGFTKYTVNATSIAVEFIGSIAGGDHDRFVIENLTVPAPPPPPPPGNNSTVPPPGNNTTVPPPPPPGNNTTFPPPPPPGNNTTVPPPPPPGDNTTVPPPPPPGNNSTVPPPPAGFRSPTARAWVDPPNGTLDTMFRFLVNYTHPDGAAPRYVEIQVDGSPWRSMAALDGAASPRSGMVFSWVTKLAPGNHLFRAEVSDGENVVQTPWVSGPSVSSAAGPDSAAFSRIEHTVHDRYGVYIARSDVEASTYGGSPAWKVTAGSAVHYVSLDGTRVLDDPAPPPASPSAANSQTGPGLSVQWVVVLVGVGVMAALVAAALRGRRSRP